MSSLPYDPAIPLLGIHTEETRIERDTCTPIFITALFIIARTWKQPRCPSADEWINNKVRLYNTENYIYYLMINHNGTVKNVTRKPGILQFMGLQRVRHD